jgi:hypothetical protein
MRNVGLLKADLVEYLRMTAAELYATLPNVHEVSLCLYCYGFK